MEILGNPRFSTMIVCLAVAVFSITLNGHLRKNMGDALFGFLGLAWFFVSIVIFIVFGWKIGFVCLAGSYLLGVIVSPISGVIADLVRGNYTRE